MLNKEIGSEFCDIPTRFENNLLFSSDTRWFISGRSALDYAVKDIIAKRGKFSVSLPSYCCDSMIEPFVRNGIKVSFYPVVVKNRKLVRKLDDIKTDAILYVEYFGYKQDSSFDFDGIIINDVTHSLFTNRIDADYTIGSLRKWAAFKTGGFASCRDGFSINEYKETKSEYVMLRSRAMFEKTKYLNSEIKNKDYLDMFSEAEELLDNYYDYSASREDIEAACHIDAETIRYRRKENARVLLEGLGEYSLFELSENDCPLFVPIIVPDGKRDELKKYLIENSIYCPNHWPISDLHKLTNEEKYIYENELSIVCDQRYDVLDMKRIVDTINEFWSK